MPQRDPSDPSLGFDPNRHRKEIEQMERRFRERSERHGGGPVSTGEIDVRVADEMRQFFDSSAQQLEAVVPQLQDGERARAMAETTGEIRKKIDDFFAEAKGQGAGEAAPNTVELTKRRERWVGMFPGQDFDTKAQAAQPQGPRTGPISRPISRPISEPVPVPANQPPRRPSAPQSPQPGRPAASAPAPRAAMPRPAAPAPAPAPQRAAPPAPPPARPAAPPPPAPRPAAARPITGPTGSGDDTASGDKMDLKTALEKLRRHGVVKSTDTVTATRSAPPSPAPAAPPPAPTKPTSMPVPSLPPSPPPRREFPSADDAAAPRRQAARAPLPPVPPEPTRREPPAPARPPAPAPAPAPVAKRPPAPAPTPAPAPAAPPAPPAPPAQRFGGRNYAAQQPSASAPRASGAAGRLSVPDRTGAGPIVDRPLRPRLNPALSDEDAASDPVARRASPIRSSSPFREAAAAAEAAAEPIEQVEPYEGEAPAAALDPADSFDSIFDEVQSIVQDTLKVSIDDSFAAARDDRPAPKRAAPAREQSREQPVREQPKARPAPPPAPAPAPPPPAAPESVEEEIEEIEDPAVTAARAKLRATRFSRPEEDEAPPAEEEAPPEPYDWGVKQAPRPKGAWLLDTPEPSNEEALPAKMITTEISATQEPPPPAPPAPSAPAGGGGGGGGGARSYLVRKAGDEVRKFQPVLKALRDSGVLDTTELGGAASASGGDDDEFMSAESFKDERPRDIDYEKELSPMQLVEEIRRLKRVTQALVIKGVITQDDLTKTEGD